MTRPSVLPSVKTTTSAPELIQAFAAQWLACVLPCRRFACTLAGADARLGADVDRYSFIVEDLHHLLLAGLTGAPFFLITHNRRTAEARSRGGDLAPIAAAFLDPEDYLLAAPVKEYSKC
jgi:hypothetical protein